MRECPILAGLLVHVDLANIFMQERTHYSRNARPLNLQDVILRGNGEVVTGESECEVWQTGPFGAVNRILPTPTLLCANLRVPRPH